MTTARTRVTRTATPAVVKANTATAMSADTQKAAVKPPRRSNGAKAAAKPLAQDQRRHYVEVAAYYIAERRGFTAGNALEDWAQAEAEVDLMLAEGVLNG